MKKLLAILISAFLVISCTFNIQIENESAGQRGPGSISEATQAEETITPTVDVQTQVDGGAL